jgi:hypothetical protein
MQQRAVAAQHLLRWSAQAHAAQMLAVVLPEVANVGALVSRLLSM